MNTNTRILGLALGATLLAAGTASAEPPRDPRSGASREERLELLKAIPAPAADPLQVEHLPRARRVTRAAGSGPQTLGVSFEGVLDRVDDGLLVLGDEVPEEVRRMAGTVRGAQRGAIPRRIERILRPGPALGDERVFRGLMGKRVVVELGRDRRGHSYALSIREAGKR
jgi:hypothetical protein